MGNHIYGCANEIILLPSELPDVRFMVINGFGGEISYGEPFKSVFAYQKRLKFKNL